MSKRKWHLLVGLLSLAFFCYIFLRISKDFKNFNYETLKSGDFIFTRGKSIQSFAVLLFDRNTTNYSHCGTVCIENNTCYIIHSTPTPIGNQKGGVVMEPLDEFFKSNAVTLASVFRFKNEENEHINAALVVLKNYLHDSILFDDEFVLTNNKLYCTELLWKAFLATGINLGEKHDLDKIIFPSDLIQSNYLEPIYTY